MASCQNCQSLMTALKQEIIELQGRQSQLHTANEYLMKQMSQAQEGGQDLLGWKKKYEDMVSINSSLKDKIDKQRSEKITSSDSKIYRESVQHYQSVSPFETSRTVKKENIVPEGRGNTKMSEFMKTMLLQKVNHQKKPSREKGRRDSKREIILRIVDDRVNRVF